METIRRLGIPLGVIAAVLLILLFNPWVAIDEGPLRQAMTIGFWVSFIALLVVLFEARKDPGAEDVEIEGPRFARFLFGNTRAGLFWLPIRLFVGFAWLEAGWHKLTGAGWIDGGSALAGFWQPRHVPEAGQGVRRSPTSGIATSSTSCSTVTTRPGSRRSSRSASWPSGSACCSAP